MWASDVSDDALEAACSRAEDPSTMWVDELDEEDLEWACYRAELKYATERELAKLAAENEETYRSMQKRSRPRSPPVFSVSQIHELWPLLEDCYAKEEVDMVYEPRMERLRNSFFDNIEDRMCTQTLDEDEIKLCNELREIVPVHKNLVSYHYDAWVHQEQLYLQEVYYHYLETLIRPTISCLGDLDGYYIPSFHVLCRLARQEWERLSHSVESSSSGWL